MSAGDKLTRLDKILFRGIDLNYHLANVFYFLAITILPKFPDFGNSFFLPFGLFEYDESYNLVPTNYYHPLISLFLLIGISMLFIILGILIFKRRDIS
jgi:hypothetical protein